MIKILSKILHKENTFKDACCKTKYIFNLNWTPNNKTTFKSFSQGKICYQEQRSTTNERYLPTLLYIQNPITWLINKIDFKMLKGAWDPDFNEHDFKQGTKQAVAVICTLISKNLWDDLRGLVTRQALSRLQRDVEVNWTDEQRRNINLEVGDVKVVLPRKVYFLRIEDQKFVDVDMLCVAMKFKEAAPSLQNDIVFVEVMVRFHRNYTAGELPNWTVTVFKVIKFNIHDMK